MLETDEHDARLCQERNDLTEREEKLMRYGNLIRNLSMRRASKHDRDVERRE